MRKTLDWSDLATVDRQLIPRFRQKYDMWNSTFTMPYHVFRQRLKTISAMSLSRVDGAVVSPLEEIPEGGIIVPVDDDDWFAPDLADHLARAAEPSADAYLWSRATIEYERPMAIVRRRLAQLIRRRARLICKTNNYAVRNYRGLSQIALNHVAASAYFEAHLPEVRHIPATLGIQNRNLASQTTLAWRRPAIGRPELLALFERYKTLYKKRTLEPDLQWAAPYVTLMDELMSEVGVRGS